VSLNPLLLRRWWVHRRKDGTEKSPNQIGRCPHPDTRSANGPTSVGPKTEDPTSALPGSGTTSNG